MQTAQPNPGSLKTRHLLEESTGRRGLGNLGSGYQWLIPQNDPRGTNLLQTLVSAFGRLCSRLQVRRLPDPGLFLILWLEGAGRHACRSHQTTCKAKPGALAGRNVSTASAGLYARSLSASRSLLLLSCVESWCQGAHPRETLPRRGRP